MDQTAPSLNPYHEIFVEFVDSASFFWILRNRQLRQPQVTQENIAELDARINANLEGINVCLPDSWEIIEEAAEQFPQGGEAFVMATTAFSTQDSSKIQRATEFGLSNEQTFKGLISAIAWLPGKFVHPWLQQFFTSKNIEHKTIAIAACRLRREDPALYLSQILSREDCKAHLPLYARCLRIIGELKRRDLAAELTIAFQHDDPNIKFWALWSSMLLGQREQVEAFKPYIFSENPLREKALIMAFRIVPIATGRIWIGELMPDNLRLAIKACGILGDPLAIDWLISQMDEMPLARVAGESFSLISGIHLTEQLARPAPEEFLITQQASDEISPEAEEDDNLPWPNRQAIATYWSSLSQQFEAGRRYYWGSAQTPAREAALHPGQKYVALQELFAAL